MTPGPIRLVVSDVDGTLVGSDRSLAPSTVRAAQALRRAGIALAVVSARAPAGLEVLVAPLGLDTPRAGFNGGVVLSPDGRVLRELTLDRATAQAAVARLEAMGLDAWVFGGGQWFLKDACGTYVASEYRSILLEPTVVGDLGPALDGAHKIMGSSPDAGLVAGAAAELAGALAGRAAVQRSQAYYVDVTHPQADKGLALELIARALGIPPGAVAAIGDMPNDVPMFEACALSFAMGNAPPAVKARARHVVAGHDEGGWAEAAGMVLGGAA